MNVTWVKFLRKNGLFLLFSFFVPIIILASNYFLIGIYPGSDRTVLASDSSHQFVNFYVALNDVLHGKQSLLYTWSGSIGLNFFALMGYYLGGVFTPVVFFFKNIHMPDAIYVITLLKFGAAGLSFWIFSHNTYYRMKQWSKVTLSICYALISYIVAYSPMIMWLDGLVYFPLVILGIHRLMDEHKRGLLYISYFILFISNYYIGFMVGLFSFMYFFARVFTNFNRYKTTILSYGITSFLAGGAAMIVILPTVLDLKNNGEKLDTFNQLLTSGISAWDIIVKSMPGVYDTSKYEGSPFIYMGIYPLIFLIFYFVSKKVPKKNKILYGSLLAILIASVYLDPLNLVWHGLHYPNMFLFRFAFLFPAFGMILSGYGWENYEKDDLSNILKIIVSIACIFFIAFIFSNKKRYGYLTTETIVLFIICILFYGMIFYFNSKSKQVSKLFPVLLMLIISGEAFFNTKAVMLGVSQEWGYPTRSAYTENFDQVSSLVKKVEKKEHNFFRLENLDKKNFNESFAHGYHGISMFSSVRNRKSSGYLNLLGFKSNGTNLSISYENNTILMDALLGVKYNLSKQDVMKYGFKKITNTKDYSLYENKLALPMGVLTNEKIYEDLYSTSQPGLLVGLSGLNKARNVFGFTDLKEVSRENMLIMENENNTIFTAVTQNKKQSVTWEISVPAHSQIYLNLSIFDSKDVSAEVMVNDITRRYDVIKSGEYINLGSYDTAQKLQVMLSFSGKPSIRALQPSISVLNTEILEEALEKIKEKSISLTIDKRKAKATINTEKDSVLFTTIPYDKGWKATIDGKKVEIKALQNALITIPVPKGKHKVVLTYVPQGLLAGSWLFVSCSAIFGIYQIISYKKMNKRRLYSEE